MISLPLFISLATCTTTGWLYLSRNRLKPTQILLFIHTIYIAYQILVAFPANVFTDSSSALNVPSDVLRARYMRTGRTLDAELDGLFTKLGSFDLRILYVQFGHDVVAGCDYCQSFWDFALLALPRPLLSYVREIAFIGALTLPGTPRSHLRALGLGILMLSALAEAYFTLTTPIALSPTEKPLITMWHDFFLFLRLTLFLILPFLLYLPRIPYIHRLPIISNVVPLPDPKTHPNYISPGQQLESIQRTLDHLLPSIHLLKYTRAAIMRLPTMRERASAWWAAEKMEGDEGLADPAVQKAGKGMGLGYEKSSAEQEAGVLRQNARKGLESLMASAPPSQHWFTEQS
ncbi:hypothetical protein FA15DRAFT_665247 [Coprinopsis marcescibilis]|uniref:Uncharacterized protein n=1 Tax=Coprinopsis marcescibilis TaxID=230819 RepID=A0A5C3L7P5_COPMA|nr:hypothetical protein FA15DRAFT_665247 [Coprinopsis marcescibilis]